MITLPLWCGCPVAPLHPLPPSAFLLHHLGALTHHAQMKVWVLSVPGKSNTIADFLSRSFHLSDANIMAHLTTHFPTQPSLQWLHFRPEAVLQMTSALSRRMLPMASLPAGPTVSPPLGQSGPHSASPITSILTLKPLRIPSTPSYSSPNATAAVPYLPVEIRSNLKRWRIPFVPWARRWPSWGKRIPV